MILWRDRLRDLARASVVIGAPGMGRVISRRRAARHGQADAPRILLVRPDHLGDVLLTTPAIAALRAALPNAQLIALVGPWAAEALAGNPHLDALYTVRFPGFTRMPAGAPWSPYRQLASEARRVASWRADAAINFRPDFWWGAALLALADIPIRIGYDLPPGKRALTHRVAYPSAPEHAARLALRLASTAASVLGAPADMSAPWQPETHPLVFALTEGDRAWARAWLAHAGVAADARPLVIHPGAGADVKRWIAPSWARVIEALAAKTGAPVIVGGTSAEADLVVAITRAVHANGPVVPLAANVPLAHYAALLAAARLVLGVDSGPLHLATAVGTPTVRLYGPSDPAIFGPWGPPNQHAIVKSATLPCIPCGRFDYSPDELPAHPCVRLIRPETVVNAALDVLGCQEAPPRVVSSRQWRASGEQESSVAERPPIQVGQEPAKSDHDHYDQRPALDQRVQAAINRTTKRNVQRAVWAVLVTAGRLSHLFRRPGGPLRTGDPRIKRILVVRTDLIGDLVLSLPAIRALRQGYPDAELDALVLPATRDILAGETGIAQVHTYDPNIWRRPISLLNPRNWQRVGALIGGLRARRYDLAVSIAGDWGSVLTWVSGARRRVGYAGEAYPGLMTDAVPGRRYAVRQHEVAYVARLACAAGGVLSEDEIAPVLHVAPEAAARARTLIGAALDAATDHPHQNGRAHPVVALHAGAQNGRAKRWPAASWSALADLLIAELGVQVLLTGSAGDGPLVSAIHRQMRRPYGAANLAGRTTLAELVAVLDQCDLLISGDSGPLHIACALGTPVVGLYGPTDPALSGPVADDAVVLRQEIWCAPCYDASAAADCRFGNPVCMKALTPARVFAAARAQIARRGLAPATPQTPPHSSPFKDQTDADVPNPTTPLALRRHPSG